MLFKVLDCRWCQSSTEQTAPRALCRVLLFYLSDVSSPSETSVLSNDWIYGLKWQHCCYSNAIVLYYYFIIILFLNMLWIKVKSDWMRDPNLWFLHHCFKMFCFPTSLQTLFTKTKKGKQGSFLYPSNINRPFYGEILTWNFKNPHCQSNTHKRVSLLRKTKTSDKRQFLQTIFNLIPQHPRKSAALLHSCVQLIDRQRQTATLLFWHSKIVFWVKSNIIICQGVKAN